MSKKDHRIVIPPPKKDDYVRIYARLFDAEVTEHRKGIFLDLDLDALYLDTGIFFSESETSTPFHPFMADCLYLICVSEAKVAELKHILKPRIDQLNHGGAGIGYSDIGSDILLEMPDGLTWRIQFKHLQTACGHVSTRSCQTCDQYCFRSFGDDYSTVPKSEVIQILSKYFKAAS